MPELPEVETTRRGIVPYVEGFEINEVRVRLPTLRIPVPDEQGVKTFDTPLRGTAGLLFGGAVTPAQGHPDAPVRPLQSSNRQGP